MTMTEPTDPLERLLVKMREYIDGQVAQVREDFAGVLQAHVSAIHELNDQVAGLQTEMTLSMAFDGEKYRKFVVEECARIGVKPSELMAAKRELDSMSLDLEAEPDGADRPE